MKYREKLVFEEVSIEDVEYLMRLLDVLNAKSIDYSIIEEIDLMQLDLDALVISEFGITDIIGQISSWLYEKLQAFSSWIVSGIDTIINTLWENVIHPAISVIDAGVGWIKDQIASIWDRLQNIGDILSSIGSTLIDIFNTVKEGFINIVKEIPSAIGHFINTVKDVIVSKIEAIPDLIINGVRSFIDAISSRIDLLKEGIQKITSFLGTVGSTLADIISSIKGGINIIKGYIEGALSVFANKIAGALDTVRIAFMESMQTVSAWIQQASGAIQGFVNGILKLPEWFREHLVAPLTEAMSKFSSWIWEHIPEGIRSFFEKVRDAIIGFYEGLKSFLANPKEWIINNVWEPFKERIKDVGEWIWEKLPDEVKTFFEKARDVFVGLYENLKGFFRDPKGWIATHVWEPFKERIREIGSWIWEQMPEDVKTFFEKAKDVFVGLYENLKEFFSDPKSWIVTHIWEPFKEKLREFGEWIWERIPENVREGLTKGAEMLRSLYDALKDFIEDPIGTLSDIFSKLSGKVSGFINAIKALGGKIFSTLESAGRDFINTILDFLEKVKDKALRVVDAIITKPIAEISEKVTDAVKKAISKVFKSGEKGGEFFILSAMIGEFTPLFAVALFAPKYIKAIAEALPDTKIQLGVPGTNLSVEMKVKNIVKEIGDLGELIADDIIAGIVTGMSFNFLRPWDYAIRPLAKSFLTPFFRAEYGIDAFFEVPSFSELRDIVRRYYPVNQQDWKKYVEILNYFRNVLDVRGFPSTFINEALKQPDELFIKVKGRFYEIYKKERLVPLSLLFEQPSISDVCTFMVRDIIADPNDFIKWMSKIGVYRDVALFYYLLHYRYPSPSDLANFVWRGIAGLLWNTDKEIDQNVLSAFGITPEQVEVSAPSELNFDGKFLFNMLRDYMKWHDYARFPWKKKWPTDNAIMVDLLADIPGKIDLRWMGRWGIFEYWTAKGKDYQTTIEEITRKLLVPRQTTPAKDVIDHLYKQLSEKTPTFDVTQLCRTLQATGIHPYWIPWVAIAESINALTEERTLLRTGFMNMYEEGLLDIDTLNQLLSGFFTVQFNVAYYDMRAKQWVDSSIEIPIAFLPAESKLMELRSIFDRVLSLYREFYSEIRKSIRYGIYDPKTAKKILKEVIETLSGYAAGLIESVTGRKLEVKLDTGYIDNWVEIESKIQDIEKKISLRYTAQSVLGWLLYRMAYGWVTEQDFKDVVDILTKKFYIYPELGDAVIKLGKKLSEIMRKQEREVYVPTPSQLATFSEYMDIPDDVIKEAFKERDIKAPWDSFWYRYIITRAISTETNSLVSVYRRIVEYFTVPEELTEKVKELMVKGGWTSKELPIFDLEMELRKFYRIMTYFVPTMRGFVSDAMYMDNWEERLQEWLVIRGIDPEKYKDRIDYYKHLIKARKVYRRFSWYLTRLLNAYCAGIINENQVRQKLQRFKPYGLSDEEIEIIIDGFRMEKAYREAIYGAS